MKVSKWTTELEKLDDEGRHEFLLHRVLTCPKTRVPKRKGKLSEDELRKNRALAQKRFMSGLNPEERKERQRKYMRKYLGSLDPEERKRMNREATRKYHSKKSIAEVGG